MDNLKLRGLPNAAMVVRDKPPTKYRASAMLFTFT